MAEVSGKSNCVRLVITLQRDSHYLYVRGSTAELVDPRIPIRTSVYIWSIVRLLPGRESTELYSIFTYLYIGWCLHISNKVGLIDDDLSCREPLLSKEDSETALLVATGIRSTWLLSRHHMTRGGTSTNYVRDSSKHTCLTIIIPGYTYTIW